MELQKIRLNQTRLLLFDSGSKERCEDDEMPMVPGKAIHRDPYIYYGKTGTDSAVWVAMKVTYQNGNGEKLSADETKALIDPLIIDYQTDKWERISDRNQSNPIIFKYREKLKPQNSTIPLFTTIKIDEQTATLSWLYKITNPVSEEGSGGYQIKVEGAAVGALGVGENKAKQVLRSMF